MDGPGPLANRAEPALGVSGLYTRAYPGFLAPASLKRVQVVGGAGLADELIRGFLPRPH